MCQSVYYHMNLKGRQCLTNSAGQKVYSRSLHENIKSVTICYKQTCGNKMKDVVVINKMKCKMTKRKKKRTDGCLISITS